MRRTKPSCPPPSGGSTAGPLRVGRGTPRRELCDEKGPQRVRRPFRGPADQDRTCSSLLCTNPHERWAAPPARGSAVRCLRDGRVSRPEVERLLRLPLHNGGCEDRLAIDRAPLHDRRPSRRGGRTRAGRGSLRWPSGRTRRRRRQGRRHGRCRRSGRPPRSGRRWRCASLCDRSDDRSFLQGAPDMLH